MGRVNSLVYQPSATNRFATLFYAQCDPANRRLSYVNAGHNPPVVLRNRAASYQVLRLDTGPVIGLLPHRYQRGLFSHEAGDLVVLFAEGVFEPVNVRIVSDSPPLDGVLGLIARTPACFAHSS